MIRLVGSVLVAMYASALLGGGVQVAFGGLWWVLTIPVCFAFGWFAASWADPFGLRSDR